MWCSLKTVTDSREKLFTKKNKKMIAWKLNNEIGPSLQVVHRVSSDPHIVS